uniref:E3 ubiquitin-protein ligase HERC2 n=3 Tax=Cacopsylla melanoneura TaxID=428564 RepID=A0A8D8RL73_9HEMI
MSQSYWCNCCFHKDKDNCQPVFKKEVTSDQLLNFWTLGKLPEPTELIDFIGLINHEGTEIIKSALIPDDLHETYLQCDYSDNTSRHFSKTPDYDDSISIGNEDVDDCEDYKADQKVNVCKIQKALPCIMVLMTDEKSKSDINLFEKCLLTLETCIDLSPSCPHHCKIMTTTIEFFSNVVFNQSIEKDNMLITSVSLNILLVLVFLQASLNQFLDLVLKLLNSPKFKTNKLNESFKKNALTFLSVFSNVVKRMPKKETEVQTLPTITNDPLTVEYLTRIIMEGLDILARSYLKSLTELQNDQEVYVWESSKSCVRSVKLLDSNSSIVEMTVFRNTILIRTSDNELYCKVGVCSAQRIDMDCSIVKMASHIQADRALVISQDGEVYNIGDSSFTTDGCDSTSSNEGVMDLVKVFFVNDHVKIKFVACGDNYCAAINELGEVFTWGNNAEGRLGQGHDNHAVLPVQIKIPSEHKAVEVALGSGDHAHALVLTEFGYIYGFGCNLNGKLGVPLISVSGSPILTVKSPILVSTLVSVQPKHVYVGEECSFVLTQSGQIYSWGSGQNYIHGHSHLNALTVPTLIADLKDEKFKHISVGQHHCLAVTQDGHLYTWGQSHDKYNDYIVPSRFYTVSNMKVEHCVAGTDCNFAWGVHEDNVQDESFVLELSAQTFQNLYEFLKRREFVGATLSLLELHCYLWYKRRHSLRQDIDKELKSNYISLLCTLIRQNNVHREQGVQSLKLFLGTFLITLEDNINLLNDLLEKEDISKYWLVINNVLATLLSKRFSQTEIRAYFEYSKNPNGVLSLDKLWRKMFSWQITWASNKEMRTTREYLIQFVSLVQDVLFESSTSNNIPSNEQNILEFLRVLVEQCVICFSVLKPLRLDELVFCLMPLLQKTMCHLIKAEENLLISVSSHHYVELLLPLLNTLDQVYTIDTDRRYNTHTEQSILHAQDIIEAIQSMRTAVTLQRNQSDIVMIEDDHVDDFVSIKKAIAFFLGRCAHRNANSIIENIPCRMKYQFLRGGLCMDNTAPCDVDSNLKVCGIPTVDVQNILFKHFCKGRNEEPSSTVHSLVEKTLSLALCCLVKQANIEQLLQQHMLANFTEKSRVFVTLTQSLVNLKIELLKRKHMSPEEHEKLVLNIRLKCIFLINEVNSCCDRQVYLLNQFIYLGKPFTEQPKSECAFSIENMFSEDELCRIINAMYYFLISDEGAEFLDKIRETFHYQNLTAKCRLQGYGDAISLLQGDFSLAVKSSFLLGWTTSHKRPKVSYCLDGLFFIDSNMKYELLDSTITLYSSVLEVVIDACKENYIPTISSNNAHLLCVTFSFLCNVYSPVDLSSVLNPNFLQLLEKVYTSICGEPYSGISIYDAKVKAWIGSRVIYLDTIFSEENEGTVIDFNMTSNIVTMRNEQGKIFKDFASRFTLVKEFEEVKHGSPCVVPIREVFFKKLINGEMDISILLRFLLRNMLYALYISACMFVEYKADNFHTLNNALPCMKAFGKVETLSPLFINCLTSYSQVCDALFCDTDNWVYYIIINAKKFAYSMEQVALLRILKNILVNCTKVDPDIQSPILNALYSEISDLVSETSSQHPADYSNASYDTRVCLLEEFQNVLQYISYIASWRTEYLRFITKSAENVVTSTKFLEHGCGGGSGGGGGCMARDKDFIATCLLFSHSLGIPRCGAQMTYSFQDNQAQHFFVSDVLSKDKLILVDKVSAKTFYVVETDSKNLINVDVHVTSHVDVDVLQDNSSVREFLVLLLKLASTQLTLVPVELNQSVLWNYQIHLLALRAITGCILHNTQLVRWLLQQPWDDSTTEDTLPTSLLDSFLSNAILLPSIDYSNYSLKEITASLNSVVNHLQWEDSYGKPSLSYIVDTSEMKDHKSQLVYTNGSFSFYLTKEDFLSEKDYFNYVKSHCYIGQFILPYHGDSNRRIYGVIKCIDENSIEAMYTCYAKSEIWFETESFDSILLVQNGTRYNFKLDETVSVKKQIAVPLLGWGNTGGHFTSGTIVEISKDLSDEPVYTIKTYTESEQYNRGGGGNDNSSDCISSSDSDHSDDDSFDEDEDNEDESEQTTTSPEPKDEEKLFLTCYHHEMQIQQIYEQKCTLCNKVIEGGIYKCISTDEQSEQTCCPFCVLRLDTYSFIRYHQTANRASFEDTVGELFNFIELFSSDNPILKLNNENLLINWEDVITGYRVSSAEKQGPHLFITNSYWQSDGLPGTHWIKLNIKEDIVIFSLTLDVANVEKALMPSLIVLYGGQDRNEMEELKRINVSIGSSVVELISNTNMYYKNVDILIKECYENGRNCRINSLNIVGKRNDSNSAFKQPETTFLCDYNSKMKENYIDDSSTDSNVLEIVVNDMNNLNYTPQILIYGIDLDNSNRIKYKDVYESVKLGECCKESIPLTNIIKQKPVQITCGINMTFYVNYQGVVFADGNDYSRSEGLLGVGQTHQNSGELLQVTTLSNYVVKKVAINSYGLFAIAMTYDGQIFSWGHNTYGQLGLGHRMHMKVPQPLLSLSCSFICDVSCGVTHAAAVTTLGELYIWGHFGALDDLDEDQFMTMTPFKVVSFTNIIIQVMCGRGGVTLVLDSEHNVFAWVTPKNDLTSVSPLSSPPQRVKSLCDIDVVGLECGAWSSLALTGICQVYIWSNNFNFPAVLVKVDAPIIHIAAGADYCFAIAKNKQIYVWRDKEHHNDPRPRDSPEVHPLESATQSMKLATDEYLRIASGSTHFIVYTFKETHKTNNSIVETICCKSKNNMEASACPEDIHGEYPRDNSPPLIDQVVDLAIGAKQRAAEQLIYTLKIQASHMVLHTSLHNLGLHEMFRKENHFNRKNQVTGTSSNFAAVDTLVKFIQSDMSESDFIKCFKPSSMRPLLHLMKIYMNLGQMNKVRALQSLLSVLTKDNPTISNICLGLMIKELDNVFSRYLTMRNSHLTVSYYEKDVPQGSIYFKGGVSHLTVNIGFNLMSIFNRRDDVKIYDSNGKLVASFLYAEEIENNRYSPAVMVKGNKIEYLDSVDPQWRGEKLAWNLEVHSHCKVNFLQIQAEPCLDTVKLLESTLTRGCNHLALQGALWRVLQQPDKLSIRNTTWCVEKLVSNVSKQSTPQLAKKAKFLSNAVFNQHVFEQPTSNGDPYMNSDYYKNLLALSCKLDVNISFQWFSDYRQSYQIAESLIQREMTTNQTDLIQDKIPKLKIEPAEFEKIKTFSEQQDAQLLDWFTKNPASWKGENNTDPSRITSCFGWGHNHRGQLGFLQTDVLKIKTPTYLDVLSDLNPSMIVGGDQSVFAIGWNGQVYAMGSNAQCRLGVTNESPLQVVTKPTLVKLPAVPITKVAVNPSGRHTLALTSQGEVFVWGDNRHGQHGMHTADLHEKPRKITTFEKDDVIIDIACGGTHCVAINDKNQLYTWGKELHMRMSTNEMARRQNKAKLHVPLKVKFQMKGKNLKVEKASCGPCDAQTFALTHDGSLWYWGCDEFHETKPDDMLVPKKVDFLCNKGVIQIECGASFFVALLDNGSVYSWGKSEHYSLGKGAVQYVQTPQRVLGLLEKKVTSIAVGALHCIACTSEGEVYTWGDNDQGQLGNDTTLAEKTPRKVLIIPPSNKSVTAICGSAHSIVLAVKEPFVPALPKVVPPEYYLLQDIPINLLRYRMMYLYRISSMLAPFLLMLPQRGSLVTYNNLKNKLLYSVRENTLKKVLKKTMMPEYSRDYPPRVLTLKRNHSFNIDIPTDDIVFTKTTFEQMSFKYVPIIRDQLLLPSRLWKVIFLGESVDDAGGGYNECLSELCEELRDHSLLKVLIPTPNSNDENGSNRDKFVLNPDPFPASGSNDKLFLFLGILLGIAIRTGQYLNLFLAEPIWTLITGDILSLHDLMEIDQNFITVLSNMTRMKGEEINALQMPFSISSSSNRFVYLNTLELDITESNLRQFVVLALQYRLHEFDERIHFVRKGLFQVVPGPLLNLFSGAEIETLVCSTPKISVDVLKQVTFYKDDMNMTTPQIIWFWEVLEEMTNEDRVLFIRFVSGRSRLAKSAREFRGLKFEIQFLDRDCDADTLFPESSTCFFLLRLPRYTDKDILKQKLMEAIHLSKAINTDDNILAEYLDGNESPVNSIDNSDVDE